MTHSPISLLVQEMSAKRKSRKKSPEIKEALDDTGAAYGEVKKDLSAYQKRNKWMFYIGKVFQILFVSSYISALFCVLYF